ncbi:MAG: nucleoside hydrolase [Hydrogenibacillus sp.]|nr:nucleoside hydrolase [Hydrogenibacillus sp.]
MPKKVILDVDTGIDDAVAILLAVHSPELEVLGIGTVHGNTTADVAAANTLRVLKAAGRLDIPVATGATRPLNQPLATSPLVHGEDGLGNLNLPHPQAAPSGEHAVDQIIRLAEAHPGEITLIATAPLTNLALALALEPRLSERIAEVVIMGGSAFYGGNLSAWAEANIGHDPEAAAAVFQAGWPVTMIGLDVTMQAWFTREMHAALGASPKPGAALAYEALRHYLDFYERFYGQGGCAQHDALAVAYAIDPSLVTTALLPVRIETRGEATRGMTVVDRRAFLADRAPFLFPDRNDWHTRVALAVDSERFLNLLMERLT